MKQDNMATKKKTVKKVKQVESNEPKRNKDGNIPVNGTPRQGGIPVNSSL